MTSQIMDRKLKERVLVGREGMKANTTHQHFHSFINLFEPVNIDIR